MLNFDLSEENKFSVPSSKTGKGIFIYELKSQDKILNRGKFAVE